MDSECEELRDRVLETEGERDELQGVVENLQTDKDKLSVELDSKQVYRTKFCLALFCTSVTCNVYMYNVYMYNVLQCLHDYKNKLRSLQTESLEKAPTSASLS